MDGQPENIIPAAASITEKRAYKRATETVVGQIRRATVQVITGVAVQCHECF